jgi:hypothetical protein
MNFSELPRGKQCNALKNTHIFIVSTALLYIVHRNQANALILVEILVTPTCLVNVKYCSNFYAKKKYITCTRHRLLLSIQGKLCWAG